MIIEKSVEFNNPLHFVFIDFTKAFDSVDQRAVWRALEKTCINKRYINLLKTLYTDSTAIIKTDLGFTEAIKILRGVKQGDILAALLFVLLVSEVLEKNN